MAKIKSHWAVFPDKKEDGTIAHEIGYSIAHAESTYYEVDSHDNEKKITVFTKIKELIDAIHFKVKTGTANDKINLNSYITHGNHYFNITVTNGIENAPVTGMTGIIMLQVLAAKGDNNYRKQILYKVGASNTTYHPIYVRTCCNNIWTPWDELVTTSSLTTSASICIPHTGQTSMIAGQDYYLKPVSTNTTNQLYSSNKSYGYITLKRDGMYSIAGRAWFADSNGTSTGKKGYLRATVEASTDGGTSWYSLATAKIPTGGLDIYSTCQGFTVQNRRFKKDDKLRIVVTQRGFSKLNMSEKSYLDLTYIGA